jgi:uncharacterized protein YjeT (DUF2065 family)
MIYEGRPCVFELFFSALALMLVLEGILPFLSPSLWRETMRQLSQLQDKTIRIVGAVLMLVGVGVLFVMHHDLGSVLNG